MTVCPGCGEPWHAPGRLAAAVREVGTWPATAAELDDHVLAALDRWTGGAHPVIRAEATRRHDRYTGLASWFAARPGDRRTG